MDFKTSDAVRNLPWAMAGTVLLTSVLGSGLIYVLSELINNNAIMRSVALPLLAIGGVAFLILLLTLVAAMFSFLGLADRDHAMALPEGSIRAVIALSLIVLFGILSVFLYEGVSGTVSTIENLNEPALFQFLETHPTAQDIQAVLLRDAKGTVVKNAQDQNLYTVTYRSVPNPATQDFVKQLLVLLGTLMAAITSFYLGAGTATSAAASVAQTTDPATPPTVTSIDSTVHSITVDKEGLASARRG